MDVFHVFRRPSPSGRYVINSLPKSGTHLLARIFDLLGFRNESGVTLTYGQFAGGCHRSGSREPLHERLPVGVTRTTRIQRSELSQLMDSVRPGHYIRGHLPYHAGWPRLLAEHGFGIVTIVRDPRDVVVSNVDAVLKNPANWLHHQFCEQLRTREERLAAMTEGTVVRDPEHRQCLEPLAIRIRKILPWIEGNDSSSFRFEDLVGPRGGGDIACQRRELSRLIRIVDPVGKHRPNATRVARKVFGRRSKTFNRGQVGRWREEFTATQQARWEASLGDLTWQLGYS